MSADILYPVWLTSDYFAKKNGDSFNFLDVFKKQNKVKTCIFFFSGSDLF